MTDGKDDKDIKKALSGTGAPGSTRADLSLEVADTILTLSYIRPRAVVVVGALVAACELTMGRGLRISDVDVEAAMQSLIDICYTKRDDKETPQPHMAPMPKGIM